MTVEEMKRAILDASGKFSKRQIDISGKGRGVIRLERGENVSSRMVEIMYQRVAELERQNYEDNKKTTTTSVDKIKDKTKTKNKDNFEDKMRRLEQENVVLQDMVRDLRQSLSIVQGRLLTLENKTTTLETIGHPVPIEGKLEEIEDRREKLPEKIYGFSIIQKKTSSSGRVYYKWYAHRRIENKQYWVYLGKEATNSEAKVRTWLEENFPTLLS